MGVGVIIRDSKGEVLATLVAPKAYILTLDIAEALAALKAVSLSRDLGFNKVLKGDVIVVVQALQRSGSSFSHYGHIIEET